MKVRLGCGTRFIPGFFHIDGRAFPHVDKVSDLSDLTCIEDGSCELIYACHVLEHFPTSATEAVLTEWRRKLRKGGLLRLSVPDFRAITEIYLKYGKVELVQGPIFGRLDYELNRHFRVFDFNSLENALKSSGFRSVKLWDWRVTEHSDVDDYSQAYIPHMDKENGIQLSLNMEAVRDA